MGRALRAGLLILCGCGATPREPTRDAGAVGAAEGLGFSGSIAWDDGARISEVELAPSRVPPGAMMTIRWTVADAGDGGSARVRVRTPRSVARQVVFPGGARPQPLTADPRDRASEPLAFTEGRHELALELPAPWHPETAIITLERDGATAREGPRLDDGAAVLAIAPVEARPTAVTAARARAITIDGALDEDVWQRPGHALGQSLDGEPYPGPDEAGEPTLVWFAWTEEALLVAGRLPDVDLWSEYSAQDDPLYRQEAFEVFVAGDNSGARYLEYQVSARGVTFDARFPRYRKGDEAWDSSFATAVALRGTVNDDRDRDVGWDVEVAIPWTELCQETAVPCPPRAGQSLRVNVFRLERPGRTGSLGLSLSPTRTPDFHAWANAAVLELAP